MQDVEHFYCPSCFSKNNKKDDLCLTRGCNSKDGGSFHEFPLAKQIRFMFEHRGLASAIDEFHKCHVPEENVIKDICDASELRKLKKIYKGRYDLTLLWNTDGITLEKSSFHLWPILYTFCEVPPRLRPYLIFVSSIWYEKSDPKMNLFLGPFKEALIEINKVGGITWVHPETKEVMQSQVIAPVAVADAPGRADLQGIQRFNSINGCNTCEFTCPQVIVQNQKRRLYLFSENPSKLRSGKRMSKQGILASKKKGCVLGVKGISPAEGIPNLDVGKFVFPEYLHSLLLGCTRSFTYLMIQCDKGWRLKLHLKEINELIRSLKVPDYLKIPQSLTKIAFYKAHELRAWLLFLSLVILEDFLPEEYFQHWMLLVASSFLLLQERITEFDLQAAEIMLRMFVRDVEKLYSATACKYNTHQLLHLTLTVRRWGNLSLNSAFMFESYNCVISRMIHGTKHKGKELVENLKVAMGHMALKGRSFQKGECTNVLGEEVEGFPLSDSDLLFIREVSCDPFKIFLRVKVGKNVYSSRTYDDNVKRCNSFVSVKYNGEVKVAEIVGFVQYSSREKIWCLVDEYGIDHTRFFVHAETRFQINHVIPIFEAPQRRFFVPVDNLQDKLIKVNNYVCVRPNTVEVVL